VNNNYSKSLYELYREGWKYVDGLVSVIDYLAKGEGAVFEDQVVGYGTVLTTLHKTNNINSFDNCKNLKHVYDELMIFKKDWTKRVSDVLNQMPQYSFRIRFEDARDVKFDSTMSYFEVTLSDDMERTIDEATDLRDKVRELAVIIDDYEKMPHHSSNADNAPGAIEENGSQAAFVFDYEPISGIARVNGLEVHRCQLDSFLDKALTSAMRRPLEPVATKKNITSSIHQFKMPKELRNLMFRTSSTSLMLKRTITKDDIKNAGLDEASLLSELKKMAEQGRQNY